MIGYLREVTRLGPPASTRLLSALAPLIDRAAGYLEVEIDKLQATLLRRPKRAEVPVTCEVQLVVEYYAAR